MAVGCVLALTVYPLACMYMCMCVLVQINERYLPQLSTVLSFPQSVGIVGGRPGASLYFVGVQGGSVLYLDPHEVQEVRHAVLHRPTGAESPSCRCWNACHPMSIGRGIQAHPRAWSNNSDGRIAGAFFQL